LPEATKPGWHSKNVLHTSYNYLKKFVRRAANASHGFVASGENYRKTRKFRIDLMIAATGAVSFGQRAILPKA
jgi:hypothetical protein